MRSNTEPKVRIEVQVTRADGTVEPVQIITNDPAPVSWQVRLKTLLKGD
jgi:hypothetical protein